MMSHFRPRRAPYLILSAALAVSLSSCININKSDKAAPGVSPSVKIDTKDVPTAKALYDDMRKNAAAATSVRIKGVVNTGGKKMTIDVAGDRDGKNTRAKVNDGTADLELLSVGGSIYIKADAAYWAKSGSPAAAKIAAGKYVKVPVGAGLMDDLKVGTLLDGVFKDLPLAGAMQKVEVADVDGVPAYRLADKVGSQDGEMYVSADGKAQLMRMVSRKSNAGTLDFTEWNAVPPMSAPPASEQVKIPGAS